MSKLFWDHLVVFENLEYNLKQVVEDSDDLNELRNLIDETIHHRILGVIFENLPVEFHEEFLEMFHRSPFNVEIMEFINEKSGKNIEGLIKMEADLFLTELKDELKERKLR